MTQEVATPIYIDSSSTTFVATNRAAPKKSTWVRRKSEDLNECHELGESNPIKIDECDNFADPQTSATPCVRLASSAHCSEHLTAASATAPGVTPSCDGAHRTTTLFFAGGFACC